MRRLSFTILPRRVIAEEASGGTQAAPRTHENTQWSRALEKGSHEHGGAPGCGPPVDHPHDRRQQSGRPSLCFTKSQRSADSCHPTPFSKGETRTSNPSKQDARMPRREHGDPVSPARPPALRKADSFCIKYSWSSDQTIRGEKTHT